MGAFQAVCKECGNTYMWFSFNQASLSRANKCDACWRKECVRPETFKVDP